MSMSPRGLPLWLRRAREVLEDLHAHATASTSAAPHAAPPLPKPPAWLRPPWEARATSDETEARGRETRRGWGNEQRREWRDRAGLPPAATRGASASARLEQQAAASRSQTSSRAAAQPSERPQIPIATSASRASAAHATQQAAADSRPQPIAAALQKAAAPSEAEVGARMREVLRNVAQPVVVAVARHPPSVPTAQPAGTPASSASSPSTSSTSDFHGATLTSFASLTLEPHPLVAFSLRLPSRMADCLRPPSTIASPESSPACHAAPHTLCAPRATPTKVTISLLSKATQGVADALAKPGADQRWIFAQPAWRWTERGEESGESGEETPPSLKEAVGCLDCEVVHSLPLRDVGGETASSNEGSELFICRVVDARLGEGRDSLVHYNRDYYGVQKGE